MADDDELDIGGNGNGHGSPAALAETEQIKKAIFKLDGMKRGDGNVVQMSEQQLSVLQKIVTAPDKDEQYRQALLLSQNLSNEERDRAVNAIAWVKRYGGDMGPIIDKIIARSGASILPFLDDVFTHMRITNSGAPKRGRDSRSPLSIGR